MSRYARLLRELLHKVPFRFLTARPGGLETAPGERLEPSIEAHIISDGPARTLYRDKKPVCRSLDAVKAIAPSDKLCDGCFDHSECTPQILLSFLWDGGAFRLLLAFTSARNFAAYDSALRSRDLTPRDVVTRIQVVDRGSWGELRFEMVRQV